MDLASSSVSFWNSSAEKPSALATCYFSSESNPYSNIHRLWLANRNRNLLILDSSSWAWNHLYQPGSQVLLIHGTWPLTFLSAYASRFPNYFLTNLQFKNLILEFFQAQIKLIITVLLSISHLPTHFRLRASER